MYWTQGTGVVFLRDSSGNIYPGRRNQRFWKWFRHRGRQRSRRLVSAAKGRFAGLMALRPRSLNWWERQYANSVSTDGTIIAGDVHESAWRLVSLYADWRNPEDHPPAPG